MFNLFLMLGTAKQPHFFNPAIQTLAFFIQFISVLERFRDKPVPSQGWKKCRTAGPWSQKFFAFLTESFLSDKNLFSRKIKLSAESKVSIKFLEKLS